VSAIATGAFFDFFMLHRLPEWVGVNPGLAAVVVGIAMIAGVLAFLSRAWRSIGAGSAAGLLAAAAHLEIRASDTRMGVVQAVLHAFHQWRFLVLVIALAVLASWIAFRLRGQSDV
jgi:hypothetical protein